MRLLVVEDHIPNVVVITTWLEEQGYTVDVANNGEQAVEKVKSGCYALAFMDVKMSGLDGYEATREIREHEIENHLPHMPIIGVTGFAMPGVREKCLEVGMNDYMPKPYDADLLLALVSKLIGHAK